MTEDSFTAEVENVRLDHVIHHVLRDILCIEPSDSLLILAEASMIESAMPFVQVDASLCEDIVLITVPDGPGSLLHLSEDLEQLLCRRSAFIALTRRGFTHTAARRAACEAGARGLTMPNATSEFLHSGAVLADYGAIANASEALANHLTGSSSCTVRSSLGTELEFDVTDGIWFAERGICDRPGDFGNLPGGEVSIAPVNAQGVLVVDGSTNPLGLLDSPLRLTIEHRRVVDIAGERANELKVFLTSFGPDAFNVAEIALGTNPGADVTGITVKDEKALGTIHVGFGNNSNMGGFSRATKVDVPVHIDAVLQRDVHFFADGLPVEAQSFF